MIALRLVEDHAEGLARGLVRKLESRTVRRRQAHRGPALHRHAGERLQDRPHAHHGSRRATRGSVHLVVTEHGIACLHGKSVRERALRLIAIAHPRFREELHEYFEKTRWLQRPELSGREADGR